MYIDKANRAFSDRGVEFDGRLQKYCSAQGWSITIYHLGVDHVENYVIHDTLRYKLH